MITIRVAWISDNYVGDSRWGGAEVTNEGMIDEAVRRGHDVDILTPKNIVTAIISDIKYDLLVLNNVLDFNVYLNNLIKSGVPYVIYNHDFNFCLYRNANCEEANCSYCEKESPALKWFTELYTNAKLNIFLSPMHLELTKRKLPNLYNTIVIPPPIDLGLFRPDKKVQKRYKYLYFGNIYQGKGIMDILSKFDGEKVYFAGQVWDEELLKKITKHGHVYLGQFEYDKIPKLLQATENFVRFTKLNESFGRSTIEAKACGCNVISDRKIGVDSFELPDDELLTLCHEAPHIFWDEVELSMLNKKKVLVLMGSGLGNIIQTTPLVEAFKRIRYDVDVAVWSSMPQSYQALENWSGVGRVFKANEDIPNDYDLVIETIHAKAHQFRTRFRNVQLLGEVPNKVNDVEKNMAIFNQISEKKIKTPLAYCNYNPLYTPPMSKYIVLANGSNNQPKWMRKKWPYYDELIDLMPTRQFIFVGNMGEGPKRSHRNVIDLTGKLELRDVLSIVKNAELVISNDSGIAHCSAALSTPTLVLFGATDVVKNKPFGPNVEILRHKLPCSPCQYDEKIWNKCAEWKCIYGISPERVKNTAIEMLNHTKEKVKKIIDNLTKDNKFANEFFNKSEFTKEGTIKVCWLQQFVKLGGAELSNLTVVKNVLNHFDVVPVTQLTFNIDILEEADIIVVNNIWRFSDEQIDILKDIFNRKILINYEHDHETILDNHWQFNTYETEKKKLMRTIFENSILDVFISPIHLTNYQKFFEIKNPICLPLAIDTKLFKPNPSIIRQNSIVSLISGPIPENTLKYIKQHPNDKFVIYSNFTDQAIKDNKLRNVELRQHVDISQLPDILSEHKYLLFYPDGLHSGGRSIFEAYLCCCKPIYNDLVGHGSWDIDLNTYDESIVEWLEQAPIKFWEEIYLRFQDEGRLRE